MLPSRYPRGKIGSTPQPTSAQFKILRPCQRAGRLPTGFSRDCTLSSNLAELNPGLCATYRGRPEKKKTDLGAAAESTSPGPEQLASRALMAVAEGEPCREKKAAKHEAEQVNRDLFAGSLMNLLSVMQNPTHGNLHGVKRVAF